ncbi:hypothetical protein [Sinosporangium siamense]|uniref:hypothetical protein n=1 Tax=Sinosporangium siamense TaxID=1367973 RepID=UPI0036D22EE5
MAHVRLGSFALVFLFAFGLLSILIRQWWLTAIMGVLILAVSVDIALAVRRQGRLDDPSSPDEEGEV